jgi:uncharacterized membrane protein YidH (DUF202 family)
MNNRGIGGIILAVVAVIIVILAIVAVVSYNGMRESAGDFDFPSLFRNYGIFLIAGIVIIVIIVIVLLVMRRG